MTKRSQLTDGLPPHRYCEHVETVLGKPEQPWRVKAVLCALAVVVGVGFMFWCAYSEVALWWAARLLK